MLVSSTFEASHVPSLVVSKAKRLLELAFALHDECKRLIVRIPKQRRHGLLERHLGQPIRDPASRPARHPRRRRNQLPEASYFKGLRDHLRDCSSAQTKARKYLTLHLSNSLLLPFSFFFTAPVEDLDPEPWALLQRRMRLITKDTHPPP